MRTLQEIENDLSQAREALSNIEDTSAEVYSRIVGYYRSVRNWNKGKKEEYGERKLYDVEKSTAHIVGEEKSGEPHALLFVQPSCPACPGAKTAAGQLGIPVTTVNTSTETGMAEAVRYNVMSTPTAILFSKDGKELSRARDSAGIKSLRRFVEAAPEYEKAAS
jgi:ribonucleoside-triphosphate reductase